MDFPIVNKQNNIFFNFHKTFPTSARFTSHRILIFPQNNIYDLERKNSSKLIKEYGKEIEKFDSILEEMKDTLTTMKKSLSMYKSSLLPQEKPDRPKELVLPLENPVYEPFRTPKFEFIDNISKFNINEKKGQIPETIAEKIYIKSDLEYKGGFVSVNDIPLDDSEQIINSKMLMNFKKEEKDGPLFTNKKNSEPFGIRYENSIPIGQKEFFKINRSSDPLNATNQPLPKKIEYIPYNMTNSEELPPNPPLNSNQFNMINTNLSAVSDSKESFTLPPPILPKIKEEMEIDTNKAIKPFLSSSSQSSIHTVSYEDRSFYKGELVSSQRNGKGFYISSSSQIYIGEWVNDKKEGFGKEFNTKNDLIYAGHWKKNKKEGEGIHFNIQSSEEEQKDANIDYTVNQNKHMKEGNIKLSDHEQKDEGIEFVRKNPFVTSKILSHWKKYEGEFVNDKKEGIGRLEYDDGTIFVGKFEEDEFVDGIINVDGEEIKVLFENNKLLEA